MPTSFPSAIDTFVNPTATNPQNSPSHSEQHANANDAIEALQAKVGIDGSLDTSSLDFRVTVLEGDNHAHVNDVIPTGAINGVNTVFTLPHTPVAGTLMVFLNGLRLRIGAGNDFTATGNTFTMSYAPETGSTLDAAYII